MADSRQAWDDVPNHAVAHVVTVTGAHELWWRLNDRGKILARMSCGEWAWDIMRRLNNGDRSSPMVHGGWMWCPDYNQVRDFVVVARDVLPEMTDDAVAAACARVAVAATVAWSDVPVNALVLLGHCVALRRAEYSSWPRYEGRWEFGGGSTWSKMHAATVQCRILARDVELHTNISHVQRLTWDALSTAEDRAAVGLTARP